MSVVEREDVKQHDDVKTFRICHAYPTRGGAVSEVARCGKRREDGHTHSLEECAEYHQQCIVCLELSPTWREFYGR